MNLEKAHILITGGSSGIGKATAKLLAQHGAVVLITGRDEAKVTKVAAQIGCYGIVADVSTEEGITKTYDFVEKKYNNKLDVLINNAGIGLFGELQNMRRSDFESVFQTNLFGPAMMMKQAIFLMKKQKDGGSIINIGSTSALKGFLGGGVYASSKFALRGLTQSVMEEVRKFNIRVSLVCPSEVTTAFANPLREEKAIKENRLGPAEIALSIKSLLEMDNKGFIPELSVWATNPF